MLNNKYNNSSCKYTEQIVSYIYDEFTSAEKGEFKAHLVNCYSCADEIKSFGFVRSSISEWRNEEFSNLETPFINIPLKNREKSFSVVTSKSESKTWFGKLGKIFSFNPAFAGLAILVVCVGIAWFAFNFSGGVNEIAANRIDKNSVQPPAAPTNEISLNSSEITAADKNNEKSTVIKPADVPQEIKREKTTSPSRAIVKASNNIPKNNSDNPVVKVKESNDGNKKAPSVQKRQIPSLTNIEVEEDDSIRLADLFDELDTK